MMSSRTTSLTGRGSGSCSPSPGARLSTPPPPPSAPSSCASPAQIEQLRQRLASGLQSHPELRDLLGLCVESNDWTAEEARQRPDSIVFMELFLLQVHRVPLVQYFPNLVTIKLMNIGLESTADFATLTHVEELWLSDNNIRVIEGLDNMTKLRRLYLQGNCITTLDGLPALRHLRELWVSRNQLRRLTHLTPLRKLRTLYAAENPIEFLDEAFSKDMTHLHDVNLSGCHLADVGQLCYLQQLPCLRNVWLSDPLFGDNPICRMSNYTTLALSRLDSLDSLDGVYITAEQRSLVESVVGKKTSYYEMRGQLLEMHLVLLTRHAESCAMRETAQTAVALGQLQACLQPIELELAERQLYCGGGNNGTHNCKPGSLRWRSDAASTEQAEVGDSAQLDQLRMQLARAVSTNAILEQTTLLRLAQATNAAAAEAELLKERLAVELHTAGNVRLEAVSAGSEVFTSVENLVQGRFHRKLFEQQYGITSVVVQRVRRVVNRGLRLRFDSRVKELHVDLANPKHCSRFVGLFGMVPISSEGQSACVQHALLRGVAAEDDTTAASALKAGKSWMADAPHTPTPADEGVPLTNSLFYADEARLRVLSRQCGGDGSGAGNVGPGGERRNSNNAGASFSVSQVYTDSRSDNSNGGSDGVVCHGQLVLYRTYLGKAVSALGTAESSAPSSSSAVSFVQRAGRVLRRDYGAGITAAYRALPSEETAAGTEHTSAPSSSSSSYVWYCFDRALVLADCVVDYYYTVTGPPLSSAAQSSSFIAAAGAAPPPLDTDAANALLFSVCMPGNAGGGGSSGGGSAREKVVTGWADVARDVREDLLCCATPLLQFIDWCGGLPSESPCNNPSEKTNGTNTNSSSSSSRAHKYKPRLSLDVGRGGNTLKVISAKETAEAMASVAAVLGNDLTSQLLTVHSASPSAAQSDSDNTRGGRTVNNGDHDGAAARPLQGCDVENYVSRMHVAEGALTLCVLRGLGLTAMWKDFTCPLLATVTTLDLSHNALREFSWFAVAKEAPQLQKLYLQANKLTSFHLDGSRLPALRFLDLRDNALTSADDFRTIRVAAPALEELELRGNPLMAVQRRQDAEAQLWLYLAPPPSSATHAMSAASSVVTLSKLNQRSVGAYPGTLAVQRYRRACIVESGPAASPRTTHALEYFIQRLKSASGSAAGSAAAAAMLSMDGVSVPQRFVSAAVAQLERWEAMDSLDEHVTEALRELSQLQPLQQPGSSSLPSPFTGDFLATAAAGPQCFHDCQDICWTHGLLDNAAGLAALLPNLCRVVLRGHALTSIDPLLQLTRLESLNVAENRLTTLPCLAGLKSLRELIVDFNQLTSLPKEMGPLPSLRLLSASANQLAQVDPALFVVTAAAAVDGGGGGSAAAEASKDGAAPVASQLEVLHLAHNAIADMNVIYALRDITSLLILSVMGNPCTRMDPSRTPRPEADAKLATGEDTRPYLIHVFPQLKVLDCGSISAAESARAREIYAGKINTDLLIEKAHGQPDTWATVRHLNLSHCTLTEVNQLEPFVGLEVLQLQHNFISLLSGLSTLTRLKALDLSHNRIGTAAWRSMNHSSTTNVATTAVSSSSSPPSAPSSTYVALGDALAPLKLLESLSVEANQLTDISVLKLRLPRLKFLNARGNDIQFLQRGLEHLPDLRELLLDQNKLRGLSADCLAANKKLSILSVENNALKSLEGLRGCTRLEQLRLGANRLCELKATLTDLQACPLKALVLIGNPAARKSNYRTTVVAYFSQLTELDRRAVTQEEREKAATARVTEYVAPPNVVMDLDFLAVASGSPTGMPLPLNASVNGNGLPSRNRLSNPTVAIPSGVRRNGNGNGGGGADRFNVNLRSKAYRR